MANVIQEDTMFLKQLFETLGLLLVLLYQLLLVLTLAMAVVVVVEVDRLEATASFAPTRRNTPSPRFLCTTGTFPALG